MPIHLVKKTNLCIIATMTSRKKLRSRKQVEVQTARRLTGAKIDLTMFKIPRIDLIGGADHYCGAMQAGINVVIVCVDAPNKDNSMPPYVFDIVLAKVICQKDSTGAMQSTTKPILTA